jgi:anti-sigma regulatory factor (Ser/Thr protein kinase)
MEQRLPVTATAPATARHTAARLFGDVVSGDRLDEIVLAVSELVTNAVRHAGMLPNDEIAITFEFDGERVHVEVEDAGAGFSRSDAMPSGRRSEGGHGLELVQAMTDRWGVDRGPPNRVWFDVGSRGRAHIT